jgi:hypothetical protein
MSSILLSRLVRSSCRVVARSAKSEAESEDQAAYTNGLRVFKGCAFPCNDIGGVV